MQAPDFWQRSGPVSWLLWPLTILYRAGAGIRALFSKPNTAPVPVVCVGNLAAGGAGKTPVCLALANLIKEHQPRRKIAICSKGYGGSIVEPTLVTKHHSYQETGDEAVLYAATHSVWVAKDRAAGVNAAAAVLKKTDIIIMDDGAQNPTIKKDVTLMVVDGGYGFGNGQVMPAGPLRETVNTGLKKATAVIILGKDTFNLGMFISLSHQLPVFRADVVIPKPFGALKTSPVVAFAGIGRPEKFFESVREAGYQLADTKAFPDHYAYNRGDLEKLWRLAQTHKAQLVTTAKDFVRLPENYKERVTALPLRLRWQDDAEEKLLQLLP